MNLPHNPFPRTPLLWGAPPSGDAEELASSAIAPPISSDFGGVGGPALRSGSLSVVTFALSYTNGLTNVAFPVAVRMVTQGFITPVGIISVDLSTGLYNATTDGVVALFVSKDIGPKLDVTAATSVYAAHFAMANTSHGQRSAMCFADDIAPSFGSGEKFAIYLSSAGTGYANSRAAATVTIRYFNLT